MHTACKSLKLSKTGPCFLSGIKSTNSKHDLLSIRKQCVYTDVCLLFILRESWVLTRPEVSRLAHRAGQGAEAGCTERGARCPKHTHTKRMTATKITQSIKKKKKTRKENLVFLMTRYTNRMTISLTIPQQRVNTSCVLKEHIWWRHQWLAATKFLVHLLACMSSNFKAKRQLGLL